MSANIAMNDSKFDFPDPLAPIATVSGFRLIDWSLMDFHPFREILLSICISHTPSTTFSYSADYGVSCKPRADRRPSGRTEYRDAEMMTA